MWMLDENHTCTPADGICKPGLSQICQWLLDSWNSISPYMIRCSFVKRCTTNTLAGTEDYILWEEMDKSDLFADDNRVASTVDE